MDLNGHCPVGAEEEPARTERLSRYLSQKGKEGQYDSRKSQHELPDTTKPEILDKIVDAARNCC